MNPESNRKKLTETYPPFTIGLKTGPKEWGSAKWKKTRFSAAKQRMPVRAGNCDRRGAETGRTNLGPAGAGLAGARRVGESSANVLCGVRLSPGTRPSLRSPHAGYFLAGSC